MARIFMKLHSSDAKILNEEYFIFRNLKINALPISGNLFPNVIYSSDSPYYSDVMLFQESYS